jgi:hypothetical protein
MFIILYLTNNFVFTYTLRKSSNIFLNMQSIDLHLIDLLDATKIYSKSFFGKMDFLFNGNLM